MRVLLAGGRAGGRIVEVGEEATSITVQVQGITHEEMRGFVPTTPQTETYVPTGEMSTSGFLVWGVASGDAVVNVAGVSASGEGGL